MCLSRVADAAQRIKNTGATKRSIPLHRGVETRDVKAPPACAAKQARSFIQMSKRIAQADLPAVAQSWHDLCVSITPSSFYPL